MRKSGKRKVSQPKVTRVKRLSAQRSTAKTFREISPVSAPNSSSSFRAQEAASPQRTKTADLPFSYGETRLVLLVRDPYWAYSYWDFSVETWNWIQRKASEDSSLKAVMRIHDLDSKRSCDLLISLEAKNWYLHLGIPDHRYIAELGMGDGNSRFYLIARSNEVRTPRDSASDVIDPEWSDQDFEEIYRLSGGRCAGLSSLSSRLFPHQG